jgi:poly-beta-1,6-N-acetyl-D-glucosamine synthase
MEILFWVSAATIVYVYAGYPLLLMVWSRMRRADGQVMPGPADLPEFVSAGPRKSVMDPWGNLAVAHEWATRPVSVVIAVRNEATRLRARVENLLLQNYDGDVEIIVVSDGSTDDPGSALHGLPDSVRLLEVPPGGKAAALNAGVAAASYDTLVFADARQTFAPDALRYLVAPFDDPEVGGVTGELLLDSEAASARDASVAAGVGLYWRYEKALRRMESAVGSTLGATGAIYAMRRSLWQPLPEDTLLDDVLAPMRAVLAGHRVVFESRARAFDQASRDAATESRRKIRTLAGNVQILWQEPRLLVPFANPVWLQYVSHKVGRLLVPYALIAVLLANISLAGTHWFYAVTLAAQVLFYLLALWGAWLADRTARVAFTFVVLNYSAVAGTVAAVTRRKVWR